MNSISKFVASNGVIHTRRNCGVRMLLRAIRRRFPGSLDSLCHDFRDASETNITSHSAQDSATN